MRLLQLIFIAVLAYSIGSLLSGCHLYGGMSVHDRAFDSEFKEGKVITILGASQELNDNFEIYIEHLSMPFEKEKPNADGYGNGINQVGMKAKIKLF